VKPVGLRRRLATGLCYRHRWNAIKEKEKYTISPRVIDHYMGGSVVAYYGELMEEIIAAEQGGLTEGGKALLQLLNKKLCRELSKAA
jgi:hypothetical protein